MKFVKTSTSGGNADGKRETPKKKAGNHMLQDHGLRGGYKKLYLRWWTYFDFAGGTTSDGFFGIFVWSLYFAPRPDVRSTINGYGVRCHEHNSPSPLRNSRREQTWKPGRSGKLHEDAQWHYVPPSTHLCLLFLTHIHPAVYFCGFSLFLLLLCVPCSIFVC